MAVGPLTANILDSPDPPLPRFGRIIRSESSRGTSCQIAASNDIEAICLWLAEYRDSPHTSRSYQMEVRRLLLWAIELRRKPLSSLTREDFMLFEAFLSDSDSRLSLMQQSSFKPATRAPRLSVQSRQHAIGILSNLFNYLVSAGYLAANPLALRRGRRRKLQKFKRPERFLDEELWSFVLESIEQWPKNTHRQLQHYERSRWTIRFLYSTALRAAEAAGAKASGQCGSRPAFRSGKSSSRFVADNQHLPPCPRRSKTCPGDWTRGCITRNTASQLDEIGA
jgi:hypothetical protein